MKPQTRSGAQVLLSRWLAKTLGAVLLCWLVSPVAFAANPIVAENGKSGTSAWLLTNPSRNREIEGYASLTSVNRGGTINLFVSTSASTYTIDVYRLGWYGGAGARQVLPPVTRTGSLQQMPTADANGLIECAWIDPYTITVPNTADPTDWASGVYLAKLTAGTTGPQSYIIFTVRDDARAATYVFQSSVNTWQAYNNWGGRSTYDYQSSPSAASKVSFNRPYARNSGTGDFLGSPSTEPYVYGWEINMLRFLEHEGYDVTYATSVDLHEKGVSLLSSRKAFLSVGHDEYWSYQMKQALHQGRDQGKHLGFFSGNAVYWQVRYEPSKLTPTTANRTMVAYKEVAAASDPYWTSGPSPNNKYTTTRFRDIAFPPYNIADPIAQPENGLIGVMFHSCCYPTPPASDIVVSDAQSWVFSGTSVSNGSHLIGLLGYETDAIFSNGYGPSGLNKIADSPDADGGSQMTHYKASSGAVVFATGSIQWAWGLDNFNAGPIRPSVLSDDVKTATRNVLARFALAPVVPPTPAAPAAPTNLTAAAHGHDLNLTWQQPAPSLYNKIYRSLTPGGPYALLKTIAATTSYVDVSTAKKTKYFYVVTSANDSSESVYSNEASATSR